MKPIIFILVIISSITACSSKDAYHAIQRNQCLETTGSLYCDDNEKSYEEYKRERDELLKEEAK